MERRAFLQALGAVIGAPLLPDLALAAPLAAATRRATTHCLELSSLAPGFILDALWFEPSKYAWRFEPGLFLGAQSAQLLIDDKSARIQLLGRTVLSIPFGHFDADRLFWEGFTHKMRVMGAMALRPGVYVNLPPR
jgi:hypothetical protein